MPYVYVRSEPALWTVGFYDPSGRWEPESDHGSSEDAAQRVALLNGSYDALTLYKALDDLVTRCDGAEGIRSDGSNIDTIGAHAALGHFNESEE